MRMTDMGKRSAPHNNAHNTSWLQRYPSTTSSTSSAGLPQPATDSQPRLQPTTSLKLSDESLFDTPTDLVCPITCELFRDPVINSAGQVYERAAIEHHIQRSLATGNEPKDPVTNLPLPHHHLTPVFPMRSRAAEYRSTAARACAAAATSPNCSNPVRYLRRAAELLASIRYSSQLPQATTATSPRATAGGSPHDTLESAPGISQELISFLQTHTGPAYDAVALKFFGNELLRAGASDAAADVFYRLLLEADDQQQQLEYLELCLACWSNHHNTNSSDSTAPSSGKGQAGGAPTGEREVDDVIIDKLAAFVERQQCLSTGALIDMLAKARVGCSASRRLCEALLTRAVAGTGPLAPAVAPWSSFAELLLRYVQLSQQASQQQLQVLTQQVEELTAAAAAAASPPGVSDLGPAPGAEASRGAAAGVGGPASSTAAGSTVPAGAAATGRTPSINSSSRASNCSSRRKKLQQRLKGCLQMQGARNAAKGLLVAASLLGGQHPLLRVLQVAPLMLLLHRP